jgi:CheY-like chemotaxis protein
VNQRTVNLLLVEDDEVDIMNVQRAFRKANIANPFWSARDGIEALELLRSGQMPLHSLLVLLDLNMPRMNGIEFLRALRADATLAATPVVVLTTSKDERDVVEAYALNVAGYLRKPVQFDDFLELTRALHKYWTLVEMP